MDNYRSFAVVIAKDFVESRLRRVGTPGGQVRPGRQEAGEIQGVEHG
jgi:hypothetical protein